MHPRYFLSLILSLSILGASAQGLVELKDLQGNTVNQQMIMVYGSADSLTLETDLLVTLQGSVSKTVNLRRYELQVLTNSYNYFCWGVCYAGIPAGSQYLWQSQPQHALALTPGVAVNNFHAYVQPNGNVGVAKFRFVWFDVDQPNDSDWVDIMFDTTPGAGIGENTAAVRTFSAYPTPALQGRVDLRFDLVNGGASRTDLVLYSVLGTEVRRVRLTGTSGTVTVEQGDLGAGLYFANLEADGRPIATRRIVFGSR